LEGSDDLVDKVRSSAYLRVVAVPDVRHRSPLAALAQGSACWFYRLISPPNLSRFQNLA
jgi:hypothetical protein